MITKQGVVTKLSGEKTVKVTVKEYRTHSKYKKQYSITKNFLVHDPKGNAKLDQKVTIEPCKPISKKKSWCLSSNNTKS